MGCGNCGTGADGKPGGCKSNGGCSTGGCNRLNVYDWLNGLPLHDGAKPYSVMEISFNKGSRKEFYRNQPGLLPEKGQWVAVEGVNGFDVGQVNLTGELVKIQMKKYGIKEKDVTKRIHRIATDEDLETFRTNKAKEKELLIRSRAMARNLNLELKMAEVELQADGKKATFFYTADARVDFRELIKVYAGDFKVKVEMKQIGARQESGKVGGIGSCGRELCCSTWLTDFKSVNTSAARYQNLSINQAKLSGQCGRLKCCLNYELDTYIDALSVFPENADSIDTSTGRAFLQKRDIFKNLMWYSYKDSSKQYPLTIDRVKEILELNKKGEKPDELKAVELEATTSRTREIKVDAGFVNDVGHISLRSLERSSKKKKSKGGGGKNKKQNRQGSNKDGQQNNNPNQPKQAKQGNKQGGGNQPRNRGKSGGNKGGPNKGGGGNRNQGGGNRSRSQGKSNSNKKQE